MSDLYVSKKRYEQYQYWVAGELTKLQEQIKELSELILCIQKVKQEPIPLPMNESREALKSMYQEGLSAALGRTRKSRVKKEA